MERLVALGAGFLLGSALFALLPGAMAGSSKAPLFIGLGYFGLFFLQHLFGDDDNPGGGPSRSTAWGAAVGMTIHSLLDGAALGVVLHAGGTLGLIALVAMGLHKVPEVVSVYAAVLSGTQRRRLAALSGMVVLLATAAGAGMAALWTGIANVPQGPLMGLAAGSLLYVGNVQMIPSLSNPRARWVILLGTAIAYLFTYGAHGGHIHQPVVWPQ